MSGPNVGRSKLASSVAAGTDILGASVSKDKSIGSVEAGANNSAKESVDTSTNPSTTAAKSSTACDSSTVRVDGAVKKGASTLCRSGCLDTKNDCVCACASVLSDVRNTEGIERTDRKDGEMTAVGVSVVSETVAGRKKRSSGNAVGNGLKKASDASSVVVVPLEGVDSGS